MQTSIDFATNHPLKKLADAQENMPPEFQEVVNRRFMDMIDESTKARDKGMKRGLDHADAVNDGWSEKAYNALKLWLRYRDGTFMNEDFRIWSSTYGIPQPPHARAFGSIIRRAAMEGLIVKVGHQSVSNVKAHRAFASVWRKR